MRIPHAAAQRRAALARARVVGAHQQRPPARRAPRLPPVGPPALAISPVAGVLRRRQAGRRHERRRVGQLQAGQQHAAGRLQGMGGARVTVQSSTRGIVVDEPLCTGTHAHAQTLCTAAVGLNQCSSRQLHFHAGQADKHPPTEASGECAGVQAQGPARASTRPALATLLGGNSQSPNTCILLSAPCRSSHYEMIAQVQQPATHAGRARGAPQETPASSLLLPGSKDGAQLLRYAIR